MAPADQIRALLARAEGFVRAHPYLAAAGAVGASVALGATGGVVAAGGSEAVRELLEGGPVLTSAAVRSATPDAYARSKLPLLAREWPRDLGYNVKHMAPVAWTGVAPEAFMGFAANGVSATANTALAPPRGVRNAFAELGWLGTEGGPRSSPDPNTGPYPHPTSTANNTWLALHADALVVAMLGGRAAPMAPGAWETDIAAQVAVGLAGVLRHRNGVNVRIPAGTRSATVGSTWSVALGFGAWSAGDGGMAAWVARYAAALAAAPEDSRVLAWGHAVLADARAGRLAGMPARSHRNPAYTYLRTMQKLAAGALLAQTDGGTSAPWFPPQLGAADQLVVARVAFGLPPA